MRARQRLLTIRESVVVLTAIDTEIRNAEQSCRVCTEQLEAGRAAGEQHPLVSTTYHDVMRRQLERIESLKSARQKILSEPMASAREQSQSGAQGRAAVPA
jgi:hypothetical protein